MELIPNLKIEKRCLQYFKYHSHLYLSLFTKSKGNYIKILKLDNWILLNSNFDVLENEPALDL